jgi:hypothetical protein
MKYIFLPLMALMSVVGLAQSDNDTMPYNPDYDGNGDIGSSDLVGFLPLYGSSFVTEGPVPISNGGTGEVTLGDARAAFLISVFSDITPAGEANSAGLVEGELVVTGSVSQGEGSAATGDFSQASGRFCTASGFYSQATNQNCSASGICSSASGEGTAALATGAHSEGVLTIAGGVASHSEGCQGVASSFAFRSKGDSFSCQNNGGRCPPFPECN